MTRLAPPDAYGVLTGPTTLKIQRILPGPIDRVWAYLTDGDLRRQWLAAGRMDLKVGAPFELIWRNDELSKAPDKRPAGFGEEHCMKSRITELDPLRKLSFTWEGSGDVTFELEKRGDEVLLTIIHHRLPDRETLIDVAAGWHIHLDVWTARATGKEPGPFWEGWARLKQDYDRMLPA